MKKKGLLLAAAVVLIAVAVGLFLLFGSVHFLAGTAPEDVASISVRDGSTGQRFAVTDGGDIAALVQGLQAPVFRRDGISLFYTGTWYTLTFADQNGKTIDEFTVNGSNTIRKDPFFYRCGEVELEDVLARLQVLAQTGGQQNEPMQQQEASSPAAQTPDDQYTALRAQLPYPYAQSFPLEEAPYDLSQLGNEHSGLVYALLYYAGETGAYASPDELNDIVKLEAGLLLSPDLYNWYGVPDPYPGCFIEAPAAQALAEAVNDPSLVPQEWVEQAAKQLWGPNTAVTHQDVDNTYTYHAEVGVYTPPHRCGRVDVIPFIRTIAPQQDGSLVAEVCYVWQSESGTYDPATREWLAAYDFADPQIAELTNRLPHFAVTLWPSGSGGFHLVSSQLIDDQ